MERRRLTLEEREKGEEDKEEKKNQYFYWLGSYHSIMAMCLYATVKMDKLDFNFLDEDKLEAYIILDRIQI